MSDATVAVATAALGDDGTGDGTGVGDSMAKTTAAAGRKKVSAEILPEFFPKDHRIPIIIETSPSSIDSTLIQNVVLMRQVPL